MTAERLDIMALGWNVRPSGTIQSGIIPVDLRSDLALGRSTRFLGKLSWRAGDRHRVLVEGAPLQFDGDNELARTIVYNGRTYSIRDRIGSTASLTYVFGGYQYDVASGERGHFGLGGGAAYLDASGEITSRTTGITAGRRHQVGVPLATAGGAWAIARAFEVGGDVRGMALGRYGYFVQTSVTASVLFGPVGFTAGYALTDADIHEEGGAAGVAARFQGPVFGVRLRL